jgi:LuxR family maltose regulon positive regulatory protein
MTTPLLQTKLFKPRPRPNLVRRPHIIEKLKEGLARKLILVSAPAGYGKSTLLSEWAETEGHQVAWLSIDEGDNDLKRFFSYLILAAQKVDEHLGQDVLPALQASDNPQIESLLTYFINDIIESTEEFALILDDYHLIENKEIHDGIQFLIDHVPPNLHIIIASRVDPPLPLMRLRARDQLTEIRLQDLRFTESETRAFLNDEMGLDLGTDDVTALYTRTEGWITGLHLAALSMQNREDRHDFVRVFSGGHHYIIDYLVGEVLSSQTDEVQSFLLLTSILDRFSAPLCDAVLDISDSNEHLQYLNAHNVFLIPLDDERIWFRYHHLFSDFLNQRLLERDPGKVYELHLRASQWLEQNSYFSEAINHRLLGEDYEGAAELIEHIGPEMMMRNEFDQLTKWLNTIPEDLVQLCPWLCIIWAWMYDRWAQFDLGEKYLRHAETALNNPASSIADDAEKIIRGQIAAIRALYSLKKGQIPQSVEHSNQALRYLPEGYFNRGVASFTLGWAKQLMGDLPEAILAYEEGRKASLAVGNHILAQVIILEIGILYYLQGRLHSAAETINEAIQFKYEKSQIPIPYAGSAHVSLALILREWNELDIALKHLHEGIEIGTQSWIVDAVTAGYATTALVQLAQSNLDAAKEACEKAEHMVKDTPDLEPETISRTLDSRVRIMLAQDQPSAALRLFQVKGIRVDDQIKRYLDFDHIVLARAMIHMLRKNPSSQDFEQVHKLLAQLIDLTRSSGYFNQLIQVLTLQALAFSAEGNHKQALNSLEEALLLAEPEGYVRTFIDEGIPMQTLLQEFKPHQNLGNYAEKLLHAFEGVKVESDLIPVQKLVEPLSKRELEVLRMLKTELSGPEIAKEMMVSLNTLRTHTKNIYAKLGVGNRRSAVRKAREIDLI